MPAIGGSVEDISIRGRLFPVAADADVPMKLGGFENAIEANGDGTARLLKTRVPWSLSGINVQIDHDRADLEFLKEIADGDYVAMSITFASGVTFRGKGTIVESIEASSQSATAPLSLMGPGNLEQQ